MKLLDFKRGKSVKLFAIRILLTFINTLQSRKFQVPTKLQTYNFINSGIFCIGSEFDSNYAYAEWELADSLWRLGEYRSAVEIRKNCLENVYHSMGVFETEYAPPILSVSWTSAFGHLGSLGLFDKAQKLGIVSDEKRTVLVKNENTHRYLKWVFGNSFVLAPSKYGYSALEHPSQWHISERLQMIRSRTGFICLFDLHERVFRGIGMSEQLPKVDSEYSEWARNHLTRLGLPKDSWFVALHLRDVFGKFDARRVTPKNFSAAIDEIIRLGGWVIQFGSNSSQQISPRKGLIRIEARSTNNLDLHLYLLSESKFVLTTNSGPSVVAWSLGTPVLQTNTTSIARNILSASKNSIFLPKHYSDTSGRELSFREIAQGRLGYSESTTDELRRLGVQISENSSSEILEATKDILELIDAQKSLAQAMDPLNKIRTETSAVGFGNVAPSFLHLNPHWL